MPDSKASRDGGKVRAQPEQKRRARPAQTAESGLAAAHEVVGQLSEALLGSDFSQGTFERHAALLGDSRMAQPMYHRQRAAIIMQLQRDYGNRYVQRLVDHISRTRAEAVQAKLAVGPAGDKYEQDLGRTRSTTSVDKSTSRDQAIQRVKRDDTGAIVGLDLATCEFNGVAHEKEKSFASVVAEAFVSSPDHSVVYEIKWDEAVVPAGTHLGQVEGKASDWVVDKSPTGDPIGDRATEPTHYFTNDKGWEQNATKGRYFYFRDGIEQDRLRGGSWWFRLKVIDGDGKVLSQSYDVEVNWGGE